MTRPASDLRLAALASAAAAWALVAVGGVVRITESGLGCPDWPLCDGRPVPHSEKTAILEYSHRAVAGLSIALVVLVAVLAFRRCRSRRDLLLPALAAVLLVPVQALLGAIVVWLELPSWLVGVHFVVGMLYLGAAAAVAAGTFRGEDPSATSGFTALARWTTGAALLLVAAGAAVVSAHADGACGAQWPACNGSFLGSGSDAAVQVAHRLSAYVVAGLAAGLLVLALRGRGPRLAGSLPAAAILGQMALGIALVLNGEGGRAHEPLAALHVAGAGAVWGSLVALATLAVPPRYGGKLLAALAVRPR